MNPAQAWADEASAVRLPALWQGRRRGWLVTVLVLALTQALAVLAAAWAARALLQGSGTWGPLTGLLALLPLAVALAAGAVLRQQQAVVAEKLAQSYVARVRLALFDALATLSPPTRARRSRGSVMLRFVGDAQALRLWVSRGLPALVVAALVFPALMATLLVLDARWALLAAAWSLVTALAMAWTLPRLSAAVRQARWCQAVVAAKVHDQIATLPALQAAARQRRERRNLGRRNRRLATAMTQRAAALALHRLLTDLALAGLALSIVGLWLHDRLAAATPGGGGALLFGALSIIALVAAPLRRVGRALAQRAAAGVARERLAEFLADAEQRPARHQALPPGPAALAVHGWPLPDGTPWHAHAIAGRRVALVGPSRSGKTAMLECLAGIRHLDGLDILWAEVPLACADPDDHAAQVGYVSPLLAPWRGSVGANLRERCPHADAAALAAACTLAGWPHALSEAALRGPVRDDGANLSGTERRSLMLARALVGEPGLLLIDDVEHALPGSARPALLRLMQQYRGTLIFATHEPALAALADEIWDLGTGQIGRPMAGAAPALLKVVS